MKTFSFTLGLLVALTSPVEEAGQPRPTPPDADAPGPIFEQALQAAKAIPHDWSKVEMLVNIASAQAKAGDRGGSAKSFQKAFQIYDAVLAGIREDHSRAFFLARIAVAKLKANDPAGGQKLFREALKLAKSLKKDNSKYDTLQFIARQQAEAGDAKGGLEAALAIPLRRETYVLSDIATLQARAGNVEAARETLDLIKYEPPAQPEDQEGEFFVIAATEWAKASILAEIAAAQAKAGDKEIFKKTLTQASQAMTESQQAYNRIKRSSMVVATAARVGYCRISSRQGPPGESSGGPF